MLLNYDKIKIKIKAFIFFQYLQYHFLIDFIFFFKYPILSNIKKI